MLDKVRSAYAGVPEIKMEQQGVMFTILKSLKTAGFDKALYAFNKARHATTLLCFHRISDEMDYSYPPLMLKEFEKMIRYISKNYEVIPLEEINEKPESGRLRLVLTFDDGYHDFIENALPVLSRSEERRVGKECRL